MLHQFVVDAHRGAVFPLLLEALGLPHPGGQAGHLSPIPPVKILELGDALVEHVVAFGRPEGIRLTLLVVDDGLLELGVHDRGVDAVALFLAGVVVGEERGIGLVGGLELLVGLLVGGAGLVERRAGLGDLGGLLGLALGRRGVDLRAQEPGQVAALDEQAGQLHQRLGPQGVVGAAPGEGLELAAGLLEQFLAPDEVARRVGLVEPDAARLEVDQRPDVVGGSPLLPELLQVVGRDVEQLVLAQRLHEPQRGPRVLVGQGGREPDQGPGQHGG